MHRAPRRSSCAICRYSRTSSSNSSCGVASMAELGEIGESVAAGGIRTNYLDAGQGAPVVLIHGSGPGVTAYANWRLTIPDLAARFRVLAPDMAGFGSSDKPGDYGMKLWT